MWMIDPPTNHMMVFVDASGRFDPYPTHIPDFFPDRRNPNSYQQNGVDVTALPGPVGVGVFRSCDWGVCDQATARRNYLGFL